MGPRTLTLPLALPLALALPPTLTLSRTLALTPTLAVTQTLIRWDHTNLGLAGAGIVTAHGTAAGRLKADLLTVMLGVEEWQVRSKE